MGVYKRYRSDSGGRRKLDSPFYWMALEQDGKPPIRKSTRVLIEAPTPGARRDQRQLAEEIYRANMGDLARGTFKLPTARQPITFVEYAAWYRDTISKHHRGGRRETSIVNALARAFKEFKLHEIEESTIEEWKALRVTEVAKTSVNRELEVLKPMLAKAVPKYLDASPATLVKRYRVRRFPPITILTYAAEDALLAEATAEERALMLLGLDALMRLGDARTFNVAHDHGSYLEIVDPKTAEPYTVPTSARLRAALDALQGAAKAHGGFYFARIRKKTWRAIGEATAFHLFADLCVRAGVPRGRAIGGVTFHSLRHTGATRVTRKVGMNVARKLGGWATLRQLVRYDHPEDADFVRGVEAIAARPEAANVHAIVAVDDSRAVHAGGQTHKSPAKSGRAS